MSKETYTFQAEVSKLLDIVARSLYSHKEIFLRELISNASDACDKLRYDGLTNADLLEGDSTFKITIGIDKEKRLVSITDNGIGMTRDDLVETLGTIARSGTQAFMEHLGEQSGDAVNLIGQFGVGFYSAFMVADQVTVLTRRAGEDKAWLWTSDGSGSFSVEEAERASRGATVTLHLGTDEDEFLEETRLEHIIKTYADHIAIPIAFEGKEDAPLNAASALWTRSKNEVTEDQYKEFYHHVGGVFDEPWMTLHNSVEGMISYTNLLFIPTIRPFDLFQPERKVHVKLYVKRVFITDDCQDLLPGYLRFVRGVVDSEDLSLNISREMLQHDPKLTKIRSGLVKRILGALTDKAEKDADAYTAFWDAFGAVLKEGLYEDFDNRQSLLPLARFKTTAGDEWVSLDTYIERMKEGQDAIFYISGEEMETLKNSPQLEGFKARGIEVLLLNDPVDEFWVPSVGAYKDKEFRSVTRADTDLSKIGEQPKKEDDTEEKPETANLDKVVAAVKIALGDAVADVRVSTRLTDSPVCLVAAEGGMDLHLERMLRQHRQLEGAEGAKRILELNPDHAIIRKLDGLVGDGDGVSQDVLEAAFLLLDQARIMEGETVPDAVAFARRLNAMMVRGLA